jgi:hypothetical protein
MFNWRGDSNWRHNLSGKPELSVLTGVLFLLGVVLGVRMLWRSRKRSSVRDEQHSAHSINPICVFKLRFAFAWLLLGAVPMVISTQNPHALRGILMIPPSMLIAALGGIWLYRYLSDRFPKGVVRAMGVAFLAANAGFAYFSYFACWAGNPHVAKAFAAEDTRIGRHINQLPVAAPKYVIVPEDQVVVNGIPLTAQSIMFLTHSFTGEDARTANIHYIRSGHPEMIPPETPRENIFQAEEIR